MIESNKINIDSFTGNDSKNDASSSVASYIAAPNTEQFGGSLNTNSYVTKSKLDLSLSEYLARPKLMYSGTLTTYSTSPASWNFAYDFISSADIQAKTRYVHLVRGTFQIKLIVTAPPYATGRLSLATMYGTQGDYGCPVIDTGLLISNLESKTHVNLDLGSANSALLSVPLHINVPYVRNEAVDVAELSKMKILLYTISNLFNSQTNTPVTVAYKLYVSLMDAETSIPVPLLPGPGAFLFVDQSKSGHLPSLVRSHFDSQEEVKEEIQDEEVEFVQTSEKSDANTGPISAPASAVAEAAGLLSNVPVIGPFAMATSIGASAVSSIARLFGFSRPRDFSKPNYPHQVNISSAIGEVRAKNLTTDPNQETTIDSSFLGENGDSLSYENTIFRWGFAHRYQWSQSTAVGGGVFAFPVTPRFCTPVGIGGVAYYAPTPLAYCSSLFTAWRGTIKYKICIPANRFVRGKLRIYWTPRYTGATLDVISNNSLSVLVDLTQTIEMDLHVPYMSENMYRAVGPYVGTSTASEDKNINGYLVAVVEEPLIANNSTWFAEILIYTAAGDDFELAIPSNQNIMNQTFDLVNPLNAFQSTGMQVVAIDIQADTVEYNDQWYEKTASLSNSVNPAMVESVSLLPESIATNTPSLIHIGENVPSLRPICKRFTSLQLTPMTTVPTRHFTFQFIPYLPMPRSIAETTATDYQISPYCTTPTSFLSRMFGGVRGTMRYAVMNEYAGSTAWVGRCFGSNNVLRHFAAGIEENATIFNQFFLGGLNAFRISSEPLVIDVPFQNYHWFYPTAKREFRPSEDPQDYGVSFGHLVTDTNFRESNIWQSTGEDVQFVIYNGPPIVAAYVVYEKNLGP